MKAFFFFVFYFSFLGLAVVLATASVRSMDSLGVYSPTYLVIGFNREIQWNPQCATSASGMIRVGLFVVQSAGRSDIASHALRDGIFLTHPFLFLVIEEHFWI